MVGTASALDIVLDGRPVAGIVMPERPLEVETFAAEELQYHVKESTGAQLPIRSETELPADSQGMIYLGACNKTTLAGIRTDELPPNAFHIKMRAGDMFMAGKDSEGPVIGSRSSKYSLHDNKVRVGTLFAVYEFLDKHLGVRWLWPGKGGQVIPKRSDMTITQVDQTHFPHVIHGRIRDYYMKPNVSWSSSAVRENYYRDLAIWMRRHRLAQGIDVDYGHGFTDYWKKYGKTNPEYFALLPNGKREPGGRPEYINLCVSEPALWKRIVNNWNGSESFINCWINDGAKGTQACTCQRCRAWDVPGTDILTDRYCKFWLAVHKEARKIRPDARIIAGAYSFCRQPPVQTRLNDNILIGVVPALYYPWTDERVEQIHNVWKGWGRTDAQLYLRPNFFTFGHNLPVNISRKFGEFFSYAFTHNMTVTDFDQRPAPWASQGPALYVQGRMHRHGDWPVDKVLDEYYGGFARAKAEVRAYFAHWEQVTYSELTENAYRAGWKSPQVIPPITNNHEHRLYRWSELFITDDDFAKGRTLLEKARQAAKGDATATERTDFLDMGLCDYELTRATSLAFRAYKQGGDIGPYAGALKALDEHRAAIDRHHVADMGYLHWKEFLWNRAIVDKVSGQ